MGRKEHAMPQNITRRKMFHLTGAALAAGALAPQVLLSAGKKNSNPHGFVMGDAVAGPIGEKILAEGGNAIDAAITAAFASMISSPSKCGPGGYGGSMMIALAGGKKIACIDFNSTAPAAAKPDMYPVDAAGNVKGRVNFHGWLAAGVPGTMAGLQMALERYGTKSLREVLQPAIALAKARPQKNEPFQYAALANLLSTFAERNSAESMYRGDVAQEIADAFKKSGGLVTSQDLAAYHARELTPYEIRWKDFSILTAPLCSAGVITLEALQILKAVRWEKISKNLEASHAKLEALRLAWKDRWDLFGDPEFVEVPIKKLLSDSYARELAAKVREAVKARKALSLQMERSEQSGTMNISAVDKHGNMIACTFTQGGSYGARVTVESIGMVLGHGMSRFDPRPGKPNSVAPGKHPVHNMSPTLLMKNGKPVVAIGAAGGTKIPCAIYDFITAYVGRGESFEKAVDAPRLNTVGTMDLRIEKTWPRAEVEFFRKLGYKCIDYPGAYLSAVGFNAKTGQMSGRSHFGNPFQAGEEKVE